MKKILSILFLIAIAYSCNGPGDEKTGKKKPVPEEEIATKANRDKKEKKQWPESDSCTFDYKHPDHPEQTNKKFSKKLRLEEAMGGVKRGKRPVYGSDPVATTTTNISGATVIYLNFWGATVTGTNWNVYQSTLTITDAGLSQAEIDAVVSRVTNDLDTFNVVVTTDQKVYDAAPATKRIHVLITQYNEFYGSGAGGVAERNSLFSGKAIVFVFSKLYGYNTHKIAATAKHEVGHTIGARHDVDCVNGVITNGYKYGCRMGNNVDSPTDVLCNGTCSAACSIQNSFALHVAGFGLKVN